MDSECTDDDTEEMPSDKENQEPEGELYCTCRRPDDGSKMVCCDECEEWFHLRCTDLEEPPEEAEDWFCKKCVKRIAKRAYRSRFIDSAYKPGAGRR